RVSARDAQGGLAGVWARKERQLVREAVAGHARAGGVVDEVDAVAGSVVWGTRATCLAAEHTGDDSEGNVSDVVVGPPAIRPASGVGRGLPLLIVGEGAEPLLVFGSRRGNAEVESEELRAGGPAIG